MEQRKRLTARLSELKVVKKKWQGLISKISQVVTVLDRGCVRLRKVVRFLCGKKGGKTTYCV